MGYPNSYWSMTSDSEQSRTETTWYEVATLDFTAPAQGDYLIFVSFQMTVEATTFIFGRAELDNTTTILNLHVAAQNNDKLEDYKCFSTFYIAESLASGSHYVDVDAYTIDGANPVLIKNIKIVVIRMDDWLTTTGMYDYNADETEDSIPADNNTFVSYLTLTFTPDSAGDYLVLGSCELQCGDTAESIAVRLNYDSASEVLPVENTEESNSCYLSHEPNRVATIQGVVWGGIINIPASSKSIDLECTKCNGNDTTAKLRKKRIIAIRIGAMSGDSENDEDVANTSTATQWADKSTITFTPSGTQDWLIISSICIKPDAANAESAGQLNQTAGSGSGVKMMSVIDSRDSADPADVYPMFCAFVQQLANISQTYKTQYGYDACGVSGTTYSKGSFIVAVPIEETVAGWTHDIKGVANANIAKISGIAKANIAKVSGV